MQIPKRKIIYNIGLNTYTRRAAPLVLPMRVDEKLSPVSTKIAQYALDNTRNLIIMRNAA